MSGAVVKAGKHANDGVVWVKATTKKRLVDAKIVEAESYDAVINRALDALLAEPPATEPRKQAVPA